MREAPNIIITGTPGVGKTTLCESLGAKGVLRHLSVNQVVKDKGCHEGWSEEHQSWIVDEDKVRHEKL
jgi:adenylate kinase